MSDSRLIRKQFLDFFESKGHKIVPSAPVVIKNDPTLLFTNAGMNPFKDFFLGERAIQYSRIADTQKCLRVSGKHNDLEEVGHDTYHHTLFEMLGNWSFGDYFKTEAIAWAWELLTEVYHIPTDRLYVTVFGGDEQENLAFDSEAKEEWKKWISEDRILSGSKKDNFWEMGESGPCGPCSEIHVDLRTESERKQTDGYSLVNMGHPQVVEIWNLVFMEFNRKADGSLVNLPSKHVDTGMGFERLCMALQGVQSTYDTDIFAPLKDFLKSEYGCVYGINEEKDIAIRVIIDHIRAVTFSIADGQLPSNTGAGYVIRRILRRASRYGFRYLDLHQPFLFTLVQVLAKQFSGVFDEVFAQKDFIARIIAEEEKGFLNKLEKGSARFNDYLEVNKSKVEKMVDGNFAFELFDTFGFPYDLTALMAKEAGWEINHTEFTEAMAKQKARSKAAAEAVKGDWVEVMTQTEVEFVGYESLESITHILKYRLVSTQKGEQYHLVLAQTPFYAESGGQVGDIGELISENETILVLDTKKENDLIVHYTNKLPENPGVPFHAKANKSRRQRIMANHSATHLLHASLRKVLGIHVEQKGSLVNAEGLRFDFSHFAKMTDEEIQKVESEVNAAITLGIAKVEDIGISLEEAKNRGAMALFGEKYGEKVRMITFDPNFSIELCGGTHVNNTLEIRAFKILSESSVAAGIRRIEAITSEAVFDWYQEKNERLQQIHELLKSPKDIVKSVKELIEVNHQIQTELETIRHEKVIALRNQLLEKVQISGNVNLLAEQVSVSDAESLKHLSFELRKMTRNAVIALGADFGGKPMISVILSEDLEPSGGLNATTLIKAVSKEIEGGGGGQPFYATAGGKKSSGLLSAINQIRELVLKA